VRVPVTVQGIETYPNDYEKRLKTLLKGMVQQGLGLSMGSGTFGRYKVDAITLKAEGGSGQHDDVAFGRLPHRPCLTRLMTRVVESLCRSLNNLLEHLHQSFFFYFILSPTGRTISEPGKFVSIGTYLPAAMILAAAFSVTAITLWIQTRMMAPSPDKEAEKDGKKDGKEGTGKKSTKQVVPPIQLSNSTSLTFSLSVISILYAAGFLILVSFDWIQKTSSKFLPVTPPPQVCVDALQFLTVAIRLVEIALPLILRNVQTSRLTPQNTDSKLLKTFSLLTLGMSLSTLSTLNFSLGFFIGTLCAPLTFLSPVRNSSLLLLAFLGMQLVSPVNWVHVVAQWRFGGGVGELAQLYRFAWKVLGVWTPLVWWVVWWPAWVAGLVVLASPA
jgi:glycosylphosphatidylinositol transamidase